MKTLLRALNILHTCCRYRLDTLSSKPLPWYLRLVFACFPQPTHNRGKQLRLACEELGPIFVKFGQLLSTRPDLIPSDIIEELNHLQDNVAPFAPDIFQAIVERELVTPIEQAFAHFERQPLASASVAQVHGATLQNGQSIVIKIIRPGIRDTIEKDTQLLLWLAKKVEAWLADGPRLKPVAVIEDYRNTIFDELNLQREAANASQLRRHFTDSSLLYIPDVYWDYCTQHMMVMERIEGIPVSHVTTLQAQQTNMKALAERGVEIFFKQVFEHNFFHADMHPGNIFVSRKTPSNPQYICVDMAIVGSLTKADQYYLARNLLAMFRRDYRQVAELHIQSGWVPTDTKVNEFEAAVRTVCEPIFERPLADISFGRVLINLFSTARRFNMEVQPQLVLLQKTLLNIEGLGRQLYPQLDLWQTAHPYLERWLKQRFNPKALYKELKRYGPEWIEKFPELPTNSFNTLTAIQGIHQHLIEQQAPPAPKKRKHIYSILGATITCSALFTLWPTLLTDIRQGSTTAMMLLLIAVGLWVYR